jgi:hypothetical protein
MRRKVKERKADERCRERAAEDDDRRVGVQEHPEVAAHQDEGAKHDRAGKQAEAG